MKKLLCAIFLCLFVSQLQGSNINWSSPPTVLSGALLNASDPHVAVDASGNAVAVWVENNFVKASSKSVSGGWSSEVTLSLTGASSPRVVADNSGNATAVWVESGVVKAASKPFGGSWSSSTALSSTVAASPSLCVDAAGDVIAAWARSGAIESSTKLFGGNWGSHNTIANSSSTSPIVAVGGSGSNTRAVIVWQGVSSGTNAIFSSTKLISGNWSTGVVISDLTHNAATPFTAVDVNGNALAIWYAYDIIGNSNANVVVQSAGRPASTGVWGAISSLSHPGIRNPSTLSARIAFDSIGNAVALWNTSFDDETFNIESAVKPVNGCWSSAVDLAASNLYAYSGELSVTSFGDVLSLYMFYNGSALLIQSIESDVNGFLNNFWSVPITISTGADNAFPKVAATLNGNVIQAAAVWVNYNGTNTQVVASTGSKTLVLPPSSLTVTQSSHNFGVFTEFFNTLSWHASTDPNAVGYLIFRNGEFITQVGAGTLQFVDDNRAQNGSVTYSVTAVDSQQTQSASVSVNFP